MLNQIIVYTAPSGYYLHIESHEITTSTLEDTRVRVIGTNNLGAFIKDRNGHHIGYVMDGVFSGPAIVTIDKNDGFVRIYVGTSTLPK